MQTPVHFALFVGGLDPPAEEAAAAPETAGDVALLLALPALPRPRPLADLGGGLPDTADTTLSAVDILNVVASGEWELREPKWRRLEVDSPQRTAVHTSATTHYVNLVMGLQSMIHPRRYNSSTCSMAMLVKPSPVHVCMCT